MKHHAAWPLKCVYSITILSAVLPIGIASSGWVATTLGGGASPLAALGILGLYLGALVAIANWFAGPFMRMLITSPSESGVEFYVVGVYLALMSGIGVSGLVLFELSRLLSFEANARSGNS